MGDVFGGGTMIPILVIFDCDGVLVDTETVTDGVLANYVSTHGAQITRAQVHDLFTGGTMEGAGQEAAKRGAILPDTWLNEIYAAIFKELGEGVDVFPGLIDLLDALDTQGIPYAVASNGPMAKMRISLGPSGLWDRLTGRIYSREDYAPKPAPDMLLAACAATGVKPCDAIMIDDTPVGTRAADAAGMPAIGFSAASDAAKLMATGHPVAHTMAQVQKLLGL